MSCLTLGQTAALRRRRDVQGGWVNIKFAGKLLQTFSDSDCGTLPISGEAQIPELILPFSPPFTLPGCRFCQSLYSSPPLSRSLLLPLSDSLFPPLDVSKSFFSHSIFSFFPLFRHLQNSACAFYDSHTGCSSSPSQLRPRSISPTPSLPRFISHTLPLLFFVPSGREIKMSAGGTGQAVCLHLIITVPYRPAGGHAALIVDETSHTHTLSHTWTTQSNTWVTPTTCLILYLPPLSHCQLAHCHSLTRFPLG